MLLDHHLYAEHFREQLLLSVTAFSDRFPGMSVIQFKLMETVDRFLTPAQESIAGSGTMICKRLWVLYWVLWVARQLMNRTRF